MRWIGENWTKALNWFALITRRRVWANHAESRAIVTDMDLPAAKLWRLYRDRTDCENHIKELKYELAE